MKFAASLGLAIALFAGTAQAQKLQTHQLTFASGYPATFAWTDEEINRFLPQVNKELEKAGSQHRVKWNVAVGGTLATMPNMLEAMSTGLADVGHVVHLFEPVRLPLQNVVSAAPFGSTDPRIATMALHELQKTVPAMKKAWESLDLVYLTSFSFDSYLIVSSKPIKDVSDLNGMKIAAAASNLPWLEGTGAIPVAGTMGTAYNDIKTGVFTAAINSGMLSIGGKMHEVAPYIVRTGFGAINAFDIVVNKSRWDRLPEDVRKALAAAADDLQEAVIARIEKDTAAAFAEMEKGGATITDFTPEQRAAWANRLPNIAQKWAEPLEAKGLPAKEVLKAYVDYLKKAGVELPRDWSNY
jgi:TRAP-type C4-dicarboxylate transport system substrate-binding protein